MVESENTYKVREQDCGKLAFLLRGGEAYLGEILAVEPAGQSFQHGRYDARVIMNGVIISFIYQAVGKNLIFLPVRAISKPSDNPRFPQGDIPTHGWTYALTRNDDKELLHGLRNSPWKGFATTIEKYGLAK